MECWRCGENYEAEMNGKISFRMVCEKCLACLHSCVNCKNYQPGMPNDCKVPGTDPISDREANNFCDEFVLKGEKQGKGATKSSSEVSRSLFKSDLGEKGKDIPPEDQFKSLFKP